MSYATFTTSLHQDMQMAGMILVLNKFQVSQVFKKYSL